eukprot:3606528-Pyramimonas_sp.AAC.1
MQRYAKQCKANAGMQRNAMQCEAMQSSVKHCEAMQSRAKQCFALQSYAKRAATATRRPHGGQSGPPAQATGGDG